MVKRIIAWMLLVCSLVGLTACGEQVDPNAIAKVGEAYVTTVEELAAAIDPSGNTVVTFLKDVECNYNIRLPYSCTIDLGGHSLTTNPKQGIGITVEAKGTENDKTTLQNGTLYTYAGCLRVMDGSLLVSDVKMYANQGPCVALYTTETTCKTQNRIENSTLAAARGNCFSWGSADVDYTEALLTVENTDLIAYDQEGAKVFHKAHNVVPGMVEMVGGINIYSFADIVGANNMRTRGTGLYRTVEDLTVNGNSLSGINHWQDDKDNQVIDVLMIGNSFCYYFVQELHGIANAAGVQMNIGNLYKGACVVQEHWEWLQSDSSKYQQYWVTNDFGRYQDQEILSMRKALDYENWDVVTIQQHYFAGSDSYEEAVEKCQPYAKNLLDFLKTDQADAKIYWHNTWTFQTGHNSVPTRAKQIDYQNRINQVSRLVATENQVDCIPGGEAWAIARANPLVGDTLCKDDKAHDGDIQGGQYLNACVWFETLTGRSCIGNTWRPETYALSEERIQQLQQIAHQAVAEVYGENYAK